MSIHAESLSLLVKGDLLEAGYTEDQISSMSVGECFEAFLVFHGIIRYGLLIRRALFDIASSDYETLTHTDQEKEKFVKKFYFDME